MVTTVRIISAGDGFKIVRKKDKRALFGGVSFVSASAARSYLEDANAKSDTNKWHEHSESRRENPRATQLALFA